MKYLTNLWNNPSTTLMGIEVVIFVLLGNFISPIVMGIVYFMGVTPTGLIMRLLGKDLLNLKKNNKDTYWIDKDNSNNDLKNQF